MYSVPETYDAIWRGKTWSVYSVVLTAAAVPPRVRVLAHGHHVAVLRFTSVPSDAWGPSGTRGVRAINAPLNVERSEHVMLFDEPEGLAGVRARTTSNNTAPVDVFLRRPDVEAAVRLAVSGAW